MSPRCETCGRSLMPGAHWELFLHLPVCTWTAHQQAQTQQLAAQRRQSWQAYQQMERDAVPIR
jgi:hypothetical protein